MNWRDYTSLTALVFVLVIIVGMLVQAPVLQLSDWRPMTILVSVLGLLIFFVISPLFAETSKPESLATALLGMLAIIIAFVGMIIDNQILFVTLCINLVILWGLSIYYNVQAHNHHHILR